MKKLKENVEIQAYISQCLNPSSISLLSSTNNYIYKAKIRNRDCVVKAIIDDDIPTDYLISCTSQLQKFVPVPEIYDVKYLRDQCGIDIIVMEYIEGQALADIIKVDDDEALHADIADRFLNCLEICKGIKPYSEAIGLFKTGAPSFDSISAFNGFYLQKYWRRCKPYISDASFSETIENWIALTSASEEEFNACPSLLSPIDLNLKNFLLRGKQIVLLNIPILGNTHPAHGIGAACAQLRHLKAGAFLKKHISHAYPQIENHLIDYFELWMLMGILSFYVGKQPHALPQVTNWGSPVPLMKDIGSLVKKWRR